MPKLWTKSVWYNKKDSNPGFYLGNFLEFKKYSQWLLQNFCNSRTCISANCLNALSIKYRFKLIEALITVSHISLFSKKKAGTIDLLHLQFDGIWVHCCDLGRYLISNLKSLFQGAPLKKDKHAEKSERIHAGHKMKTRRRGKTR